MATPEKQPSAGLDMPAGAATPKKEEVKIHVIPEEFYGTALKKKVPKEQPKKPEPAPAPPPPGTPTGIQKPPQKKGKRGLVIALVLAVILLGGGGIAAYFLVFGVEPEPVPQGPVCGDNQCSRPDESSASCPEDCGPPPPVCGNDACERPAESPTTCPEDCGPPPPVCGDRTCDGSESYATCPADCEKPPAVCGDAMCEEGEEDYLSCPEDCEAPEPTSGMDTDSDGLSDIEERTIYGTDSNLSNTDGDSFVDLNEVLNLFDPVTPAPSLLKDNLGITVYQDSAATFEIFRPTSWGVRIGDDGGVTFSASTGEFIQMLIEDIEEGKSLDDWYFDLAPDVKDDEIESMTTLKGYDEILSPNRMTAFVHAGGRVYVISYSLNDRLEIQYRVTFEMMVNSFRLLE